MCKCVREGGTCLLGVGKERKADQRTNVGVEVEGKGGKLC